MWPRCGAGMSETFMRGSGVEVKGDGEEDGEGGGVSSSGLVVEGDGEEDGEGIGVSSSRLAVE